MALELKSEYEKKNYSLTEIEAYSNYDMVIGYMGCELNFGTPLPSSDDINSCVRDRLMSGGFVKTFDGGESASYECNVQKVLYRYTQLNSRKIGLVIGQNDDLSLKVVILGSDTFNINSSLTKSIRRYFNNSGAIDKNNVDQFNFNASGIWIQTSSGAPIGSNYISVSKFYNSGYINIDDAFDSIPNWNELDSWGTNVLPNFYANCCYIGSNPLGGQGGYTDITLTSDKNTSLLLGDGVESEYYLADDEFAKLGYNRYDGMAGDLYSMMYDYGAYWSGVARSRANDCYNFYPNHEGSFELTGFTRWNGGYYAFQWIPYNLILTENETEAKEYLRSGRIPSDAWIYPWNPDEFPTTSPINPDDGGEPSGDNGDPDDKKPDLDIDSMLPVTPITTPQSLNPNNLYWLQKGQLASFFNWFWLDAGTIIDAGDLWDKIRGLYNDLASAVINVRYMPVDKAWIGGTSSATNIIVGQIECPMANVETINRTTQIIRDVGEFDLVTYMKENFIDYSPHTEISLYLPYHGFIALDSDIVEALEKINIKCVYDITSGTIQYMIFAKDKTGHSALINSCVSKMAVDVPVTLQSKNDRDSAIFNNVMNATAGLMSAGVSLAMKNPVGMALSIGNTIGGGTQSAQMSVKGTTGETGAFFMPQKCAIFIKKSFYKLPSKYGLHIGYPCFKSYKMNSKSLKGQMVKVQKPYIDFAGNLYERDDIKVTNKPLKTEIEKIYEMLEKGVII